MIIVYTPGVWDLLHWGHVHYLTNAAKLGDRLIVGVASDKVVEEDKGRPPIILLIDRIAMVNSLRCVDMAVPYFELSFQKHLDMFRPDIFVVGEEWGKQERHINAEWWCRQNDCKKITLPRTPGISSSQIRKMIAQTYDEGLE